MRRANWRAVLVLLGMGLAILLATCYVRHMHNYLQIRSLARSAFLASRGESKAKPSTYEFITMGITDGMPEELVNRRMGGASRVSRRFYQASPQGDGYYNIYEFEYGPPWVPVAGETGRFLISEWFYVFFDHGGLARKIRRSVHGRVSEFKGSWDVDLDTRTVSEFGKEK
jgi:hypothetical protein